MKKYIANIITASRIAFSLPLLFVPLSSGWFYMLYLFCGLTDLIDGTIARKMGTVSQLGARLDTVSDLVFMFVCVVRILPRIRLPVWLWGWVILVALMKITTVVIVLMCKKKLISIHSVFNKITGLALFLLPLSLTWVEHTYSVATICALATVAAMQEVCFVAKGKDIL